MKFLERLAAVVGFVPQGHSREVVRASLKAHAATNRFHRRNYEAGSVSRLTAEFVPGQQSVDAVLVSQLRLMRARSGFLFRNEPYAKRFGRLIQKNLVGPAGVQLSVLGSDEPDRKLRLSTEEAAAIEARWKQWACSAHVTTDRRMTWRQVQRMAAVNAVVAGEAFVRLVLAKDNPFLLSLKFFAADQFDEQFNSQGPATQIRMAVETKVATGERVNYWPWPADPGDLYSLSFRPTGQRLRVASGEMVHWFLPDFVNQTRGVPWLFSTIPQLNMLNGYAEAELVASRVSASKMGFFVPPEGGDYTGDGTDAAGNTITEVSPGSFENLPAGTELKTFDPQHPNANFAAFQKAMLRGTAAGADVAYHTLSGDLEGVNYSSARIGLLDERDGYATLQDEFISGFCRPIFQAWLVAQAVLGEVPLTPDEARTFDEVVWRPRRWSWVDPQKEIVAATKAVELRIKSRTQICADMGDTFISTAAELAAEQELLGELDLLPPEPVPPAIPGVPGKAPVEADEGSEDDDEGPGEKPGKQPGRARFNGVV